MQVNAHHTVPNMKWVWEVCCFRFAERGALSVNFLEVSMAEETKKALRGTLGILLGGVQCTRDAEKLQQAV